MGNLRHSQLDTETTNNDPLKTVLCDTTFHRGVKMGRVGSKTQGNATVVQGSPTCFHREVAMARTTSDLDDASTMSDTAACDTTFCQ